MSIFNKLLGKKPEPEKDPEQAVIIHFTYGIESLEPLHQLEDELENVLEKTNTGDLDGHEIAMDYSDGFLYMYGPNAELLFKAIKSTLDKTHFMKGAVATLRFGSAGSDCKEIEVTL